MAQISYKESEKYFGCVDSKFCTEIPLYASSISVHVKCHPVALIASWLTELFHTITICRKHSSYDVQTQSYSTNYFSLCGLLIYNKCLLFLQPEGPTNPDLLEAFVQIIDHATCNDRHSGTVTDRMICAGPRTGCSGPCFVSS